jgi:D-alanyl-D-alanine carboxypeptidase
MKYKQNPRRLKRKLSNKKILAIIGLGIFLVASFWFIWDKNSSTVSLPGPLQVFNSSSKKGKSNTSNQPLPFNKKLYSIDDSSSIWVVVNKLRPLNPIDYSPAQLVVPSLPLRIASSSGEMHVSAAIAPSLEQLDTAANQVGLHFMLASGYRSYSLQVAVYGNEVKNYGQTQADQESARPGHSEHQTGLAVDLEPASRVCEVSDCFANTPEGKWLVANSYKYGFILRYPVDKTSITGYKYEPWHIRYVGVALAAQIHGSGQTLEEFFGLPPAPSY